MKRIFLLQFFLICSSLLYSQPAVNEYGLAVVGSTEAYINTVLQDSSNMLVDLEEFIPGIKTDVRYATENNFLNTKVYPESRVFLRLPVAEALKNVQAELSKENLSVKIFDAYRPYSITVKMYQSYKDTNFVASAWTGSRHNRGCAVDLTIISAITGEEIKMPTEYDDFTDKAHSEFTELPEEIILNRQRLKDVMTRNGFNIYAAEWWHYDFAGWKNYALVDLEFDEILNANLQLKKGE